MVKNLARGWMAYALNRWAETAAATATICQRSVGQSSLSTLNLPIYPPLSIVVM